MELRLYPANLTEAQFTAGNAALCNLPFAIDPLVSQTINGDWALTFEYPVGKENRLALDMLVEADGQLYRIDELGKNSNRDGERLEIHALHLMYDLRDKQIVNIETSETTPGGINQRTALQQVLEGTPFSDGIIDTDILLDYLDILQKDVMWAIKEQILHLWGGELQPDNWVINIRKQMGQDRGVQLRHGKNIKGVRLQESLDGTITRLHILGYQGANIESINDGKDYIDSPNIGLYANIKEGLVTFPDDDLAEDLLSKGLEYLATVDTPRIRLSVDLAAVKTSVQYQHYKALEDVQLGDTVTVYHKRLDINIISRVQKREYNPVTGENKKVELGNDDRSLFAEIASMQQATEIIKMIADRKGHIRGERLRGVIDLLTTRLYASGSYSNAVVNDKAGILFENTNQSSPDYGAMYIGPGIFAIASEKNADNSWDWRTFGTGQGFYGNELVAGSITANKLASDVGEKLVISSNKAIVNIVQDVDSAQDNISALQQTAQGLQTQVSNNKNNISTLTQTANSLTSRISSVENINNNQNTQISQNTNAITLKADKTTTDGLNARLTTAEQKITPTAITQTVRSSAQYMQDLAGKQPVGDYATNADVTSRLTNYSTVEQTASSIVAAVNDAVGALSADNTNLYTERDSFAGYIQSTSIVEVSPNMPAHRCCVNLKSVDPNKKLIYQCWNPNKISNESYTNRISVYDSSDVFINIINLPKLTGAEYQQQEFTLPINASKIRIGVIQGLAGNDGSGTWDRSIKIKIENANEASLYTPAPEDVNANLYDENKTIAGFVKIGSEEISGGGANHRVMLDYVGVDPTKPLLYKLYNPTGGSAPSNTNRISFLDINRNYISQVTLPILTGELEQYASFNLPANAAFARIGVIQGSSDWADWDKRIRIEITQPGHAGMLKSSHISIANDKVEIASGGTVDVKAGAKLNATGAEVNIKAGAKLDVSSGGDFNLEGGSGSGYVGISNTRSDDVFLWAGGSIPILAPFSVFRDGDMVRAGGWILNTVKPSTARWNHIFPSEEGCYNSIYTIGGSLSLHVGVRNPDNSTTTKTRIMIPDNEQVQITKNLYVDNYVSAETLIDRTPFYRGDALRDIKMITSDSDGNIIHSSLPKCARVNIRSLKEEAKERVQQNKATRTKGTGSIDGVPVEQEIYTEDDYEVTEGRDLSVMVSMLTVAVKQLTKVVEKQQEQIDSLLKQRVSRQP